jgi:hypothetical protein
MLTLVAALALTTIPLQAPARDAGVFVAVNAEKASGFKSLGECEAALGRDKQDRRADKKSGPRGSVFNRKAGNRTRCEMVEGEPLVVVYPKGYEVLSPPR